MKLLRVVCFLFVGCSVSANTVSAQVTHTVHYQGQANDNQGVGLEGPYTLIFRLYDAATGGTKLWEETHTQVSVGGGHFSVLLGSIDPVTNPLNVDWSQPVWLGLEVDLNGLPGDEELSPRQQLTSVPLALRAELAEQLQGPITTVGTKVGIGTTTPADLLDVNGGSLVVTSGGDVGIGTTTPAGALHARSPSGLSVITAESSNNQPGLFLGTITQPDGTTKRAIDIAYDNNTSNSGFLTLYKDGVSLIHLHTNAGSFINTPNLFGLGTTTPAYKLDVVGDVRAVNYYSSSDAKFKTNIITLSNALSKLTQLRGVSYDWNSAATSVGATPGKRELGVIAQEVAAVYPDLVSTSAIDGGLAVDYGKLTAVLIEAIKELNAKVDALHQQ